MKGMGNEFVNTPVFRYQLDNGLTILIRPDQSSPIVTSMICYRVGSRYEKPGLTGISHFLEHMMFKGTKHYGPGEIDRITALNGGSNNAFTTHDYTGFFFSFASDRWLSALEIESDRMSNNLFDPREFELERQVVLEELTMDQDHPWGTLRQSVEMESFEKHPYRFPIIGLKQDIESLTLDQMVDHYRKHYVPCNALLILTGDLDPGLTIKTVENLFGDIHPGTPSRSNPTPKEKNRGLTRLNIRRQSRIPRIMIALPAPSVHQMDHEAFQVLDRALSEGRLSRLYRKFVEEKQLASLVTTELGDTYDPHLILVRLELNTAADVKSTEELVLEELMSMTTSPLTELELERAKNQCITQFLSELETTLDQAVQLASMEALDRPSYWENYVHRISQLTTKEVMKAAARQWSDRRWTVGIVEGA